MKPENVGFYHLTSRKFPESDHKVITGTMPAYDAFIDCKWRRLLSRRDDSKPGYFF